MADGENVLSEPTASLAASQKLSAAPERGVLSFARYLIVSTRPRQWTKNLLVYMAMLFSVGQAWHLSDVNSWLPLLGRTTATFLLFCLVCSAEYLVNDIRDRETDLLHPRKRLRPIASGKLSVQTAATAALALGVVGIAGSFALSWQVGAVVTGYTAMTFAYSYNLKHVVLLDLMLIAAGFVLRAMAGALVIDVPISPWLYAVTALGALFLAINKRRAELALLKEDANQHRPILDEYTPHLLDQMASIVTASTLVAYGLYTFTAENLPENHSMMLTTPFVLYGIFRYLYLVHVRGEGGSPEEVLLKDWPLIVDILLWVAVSAAILGVARE
ncbi:MAG: decaprenyl-phosphate phosphoribosyltransferase [Dehalococcoidia bacterium]|nr:decaprenyl-phosphate phosphoribosyltransferase [Dehalococcoidia bacterium]